MFVRSLVIATAALGLALPSAALADPATAVQAPVQGQPQAAPQPEKKVVCRTVQVTGSRFPERTCETKLAWDKQEDEARRAAHDVIDRAVVNTTHGD
jgi:hypothetical protein